MRIGFVIQNPRPGACGVTDYSIRMAEGLRNLGVEAIILGANGSASAGGTSAIRVEPFDERTAASCTDLVIQYVADTSADGRSFQDRILALRHPRYRLMIHEYWRESTRDYALSPRERLAGWRQKRTLISFLRRLRPLSIATSNPIYADALRRAGIKAAVWPMPGTIPINPAGNDTIPPEIAAHFPEAGGATFTWVSFGGLYTRFWDLDRYFSEVKDVAGGIISTHRWVICGRQTADDAQAIAAAALRAGLAEQVNLVGAQPAGVIDATMRRASASFAGTQMEHWEKSTGVLVAIERGIPVYFPRAHQPSTEWGGFGSLPLLMEFLQEGRNLPKEGTPHHLPQSAQLLLNAIQSPSL